MLFAASYFRTQKKEGLYELKPLAYISLIVLWLYELSNSTSTRISGSFVVQSTAKTLPLPLTSINCTELPFDTFLLALVNFSSQYSGERFRIFNSLRISLSNCSHLYHTPGNTALNSLTTSLIPSNFSSKTT